VIHIYQSFGDVRSLAEVTVDATVAVHRLTALNGGPAFAINPSVSFFVFVPATVEVDGLVHALLDGGSVLMGKLDIAELRRAHDGV